mgnify:FL=1
MSDTTKPSRQNRRQKRQWKRPHKNSLTGFTTGMHTDCAADTEAARIGLRNSKAHSRLAAFFVRKHGTPCNGRAVWGIARCAGPWTGRPTCTVPPTLIGLGESGKHKPLSKEYCHVAI